MNEINVINYKLFNFTNKIGNAMDIDMVFKEV